jgi:hypothetical protein
MASAEAALLSSTLSTGDMFNALPNEALVTDISTRMRTYPRAPMAPSSETKTLTISLETVVISAFLFLAILSWFEFLRVWYDVTFSPDRVTHDFTVVYIRFWYAVFITCLVIIIVYSILRFMNIII